MASGLPTARVYELLMRNASVPTEVPTTWSVACNIFSVQGERDWSTIYLSGRQMHPITDVWQHLAYVRWRSSTRQGYLAFPYTCTYLAHLARLEWFASVLLWSGHAFVVDRVTRPLLPFLLLIRVTHLYLVWLILIGPIDFKSEHSIAALTQGRQDSGGCHQLRSKSPNQSMGIADS